jgi:hypothetical protein
VFDTLRSTGKTPQEQVNLVAAWTRWSLALAFRRVWEETALLPQKFPFALQLEENLTDKGERVK